MDNPHRHFVPVDPPSRTAARSGTGGGNLPDKQHYTRCNASGARQHAHGDTRTTHAETQKLPRTKKYADHASDGRNDGRKNRCTHVYKDRDYAEEIVHLYYLLILHADDIAAIGRHFCRLIYSKLSV